MAEPPAKLIWDGKEIELPVVRGTEDECAIDISKLRERTGLITLDYGFMNTGATESAITFVDGEAGILRYRGYDIDSLAELEHPSFLETAWLLIYGELPTNAERDEFSHQIRLHTLVHEDVKRFYDGFPKDAHPMATLASVVNALATFYQSSEDPHDPEHVQLSVIRLLAKLPTIAAYSYRKSIGQPFLYPDNSLDLIENFLRMMFALPTEPYEVSPTIVHALKQLLILHADHEQNCSTSTVRLVASSDANIYASIAGGIDALWGPLHGGANQAAIEMLQDIRDSGGSVQQAVARAKDPGDDFRLSGFGHRVLQELRPAGPHLEDDRRARAAGPRLARRAVRHRSGARAGCAHRRVLHRAQAVPQRRLLFGAHLPGDGLPDQHVPRPLRDRPASRLDRALEGRARKPEDEDRAPASGLHGRGGAKVRADRAAHLTLGGPHRDT